MVDAIKWMLCCEYAGSFTDFASEADNTDKSQLFEVKNEADGWREAV